MRLRFRSIPVGPGGHWDWSEGQVHTVALSPRSFIVPIWVSAAIFLATSFAVFLFCILTRKAGFHLVAVGEERFLPSLLGVVASAIAFTSALKCELNFVMHMQCTKDRQCEFGPFRFFPEPLRTKQPKGKARKAWRKAPA